MMGVKEQTRLVYDRVAGDYDSWYWFNRAKELREGLKQEVLPVVKPGKILDACCGTGYLYKDLSKKGDYIGIDFAPGMVDECKKRYPKGKFKVMDAENMEFKDNSFDSIVCFWSFHHFTKPEKVIDEMRRILKPGGVLVITAFRKCRFSVAAKLGDIITGRYYGFVTNRYNEQEMRKILKKFKKTETFDYPEHMLSVLGQFGIGFIITKSVK